jgi:hypothetical protein
MHPDPHSAYACSWTRGRALWGVGRATLGTVFEQGLQACEYAKAERTWSQTFGAHVFEHSLQYAREGYVRQALVGVHEVPRRCVHKLVATASHRY